jgi:hypothetical protein
MQSVSSKNLCLLAGHAFQIGANQIDLKE